MGQAKKTITKHANNVKAAPSAAQPQPSGALHQPEEKEEFALTSEIEYAGYTDGGLHTAMFDAHANLYRRDDETRRYRRDVVIPICEEIIKRYKRSKYRLNDQPTVEEYFASIPMSYDTVRSWIKREKDRLLGLEWAVPDKPKLLSPIEKKIHLVIDTHKKGVDVGPAITELENTLTQRYERDTTDRSRLAVLSLRLVSEVEAVYAELPMPKKLRDIVDKIKKELGVEGQPKPPVSATPDSQERKEHELMQR